MYICTYVCICVCTQIYLYTCACACMCLCTDVCIFMYIVYVYICMYVYAYLKILKVPMSELYCWKMVVKLMHVENDFLSLKSFKNVCIQRYVSRNIYGRLIYSPKTLSPFISIVRNVWRTDRPSCESCLSSLLTLYCGIVFNLHGLHQ